MDWWFLCSTRTETLQTYHVVWLTYIFVLKRMLWMGILDDVFKYLMHLNQHIKQLNTQVAHPMWPHYLSIACIPSQPLTMPHWHWPTEKPKRPDRSRWLLKIHQRLALIVASCPLCQLLYTPRLNVHGRFGWAKQMTSWCCGCGQFPVWNVLPATST